MCAGGLIAGIIAAVGAITSAVTAGGVGTALALGTMAAAGIGIGSAMASRSKSSSSDNVNQTVNTTANNLKESGADPMPEKTAEAVEKNTEQKKKKKGISALNIPLADNTQTQVTQPTTGINTPDTNVGLNIST